MKVCFFGHRSIKETEKLKPVLREIIEDLIKEGADTFLLGSKSEFNDLCREVLSDIKEKYPHIKRIYVRAEYPVIDESYKRYLFERYEDTFFPKRVAGAGKAAYAERNFYMIDKSDICVFYYDKNIKYLHRKSGTKAAFEYAEKRRKRIINSYLLLS